MQLMCRQSRPSRKACCPISVLPIALDEHTETFARDLECFAHHAGRDKVTSLDVVYCSTKEEKLVDCARGLVS